MSRWYSHRILGDGPAVENETSRQALNAEARMPYVNLEQPRIEVWPAAGTIGTWGVTSIHLYFGDKSRGPKAEKDRTAYCGNASSYCESTEFAWESAPGEP